MIARSKVEHEPVIQNRIPYLKACFVLITKKKKKRVYKKRTKGHFLIIFSTDKCSSWSPVSSSKRQEVLKVIQKG